MALFAVVDKKTGKSYGVYSVRTEENSEMKKITGKLEVTTFFLIYRKNKWEWSSPQNFEPPIWDKINQ